MDKFHEREKAYEDKYAHDAEVEFKIVTRTHKYLGLWVAAKMNLNKEEMGPYARNLMNNIIDQQNNFDKLVAKIFTDFDQKNIKITKKEVTEEYNRLKQLAYHEIMKH